MNKYLSILFACALAFASCGCQGDDTPGTPDDSEIPAQQEPLNPNKPDDAGDRVPLSASLTGVQPMTGIVLWNTSSSKTKSYVQLEYSYMLYNDICKEKDVFDWGAMDRLLVGVASRGHQAVVRFRYTYPGYSCAVPDYIKKWPGDRKSVV